MSQASNLTVISVSPPGTLVNQARTSNNTQTTTSTVLSRVGTPTTSNTVQLLTLNYTAANSNNILYFSFQTVALGALNFFLFSGNTFLAGFPCSTISGLPFNFSYFQVAGSTSLITYGIYWTVNATGSGFVNEISGGTNFFNSATSTFTQLTITEVLP